MPSGGRSIKTLMVGVRHIDAIVDLVCPWSLVGCCLFPDFPTGNTRCRFIFLIIVFGDCVFLGRSVKLGCL